MCSLNSEKTFVASTTNQIKIYDYDKFTKKSEFTIRNDLRIKFVRWIPHDDKLLAILHTDTVYILSIICDSTILKLIRHYEPLKAREKFLRKSNNKIEMLNYVCGYPAAAVAADDDSGDDVEDKIIKSVIQDYQDGYITDVSFHPNGNVFCVSFSDNVLMMCSAMLWDVRRVCAYPDFHIKQCQFVSYLNGSKSTNMLLTRTSNDDQMMLTCMTDLNSRMLIDMNNVSCFVLATNGKLLINLQHTGDVLIYNLENHLNALSERVVNETKVKSHNAFRGAEDGICRKGLIDIQMKVSKGIATFFFCLCGFI